MQWDEAEVAVLAQRAITAQPTAPLALLVGREDRARIVLVAVNGPLLVAQPARAGERKFLVILATSPKQYPNPDRVPEGQPTGGLLNKQLVHNQYFDTTNPFIGSFAEYWEEISYGDVTIDGMVADWLVLPWAIQPPLVNPNDDDPTSGPGEDADRNSPEFFYDLDDDGSYGYGKGEPFNHALMAVIRDFDGDPYGVDNGPDSPEPGSGDVGRNAGKDVWKPGERYLDIDGDNKWDGLDEANNSMDSNGDGRPDNLGPWIDLNFDGLASQPAGCIYLPDSDNDGNPDCCPDGPGEPGCEGRARLWEIYMEETDPPDPLGYAAALADVCPATTWLGPVDPITDCNGNLLDLHRKPSARGKEARLRGYSPPRKSHKDCGFGNRNQGDARRRGGGN